MAQSSNTPLLLQRYKHAGDRRAREALILQSTPLVRARARRYVGRGEPFDDLFQVGMIGLIKAIDRFDASRGVQLETYATVLVDGEIRRYFRDCTRTVKVPRAVQELGFRIQTTTDWLTSTLGRAPTLAELAEALELDEDAVRDAIAARQSFSVASLSPFSSDEGTVVDPLESLGAEDRGFALSQDRALLREGLSELDRREREIVVLYYAFNLTQSQIAARFGCSQMQVSRLLRQAERKLEHAFSDAEPLAA